MNDMWQAWLVARREIRERSRSHAFQASVVFLIVGVTAMLILPVLLKPSSTRDVGVAGPAPTALAATIAQQAQAAGITARFHPYASLAAAEQAVRQGHLDVLVADARRLEWKGKADEQLQAVVTGAIQLARIRERATAARISPGALAALLAPAPVTSVELGSAPGRSPGDEAAVLIMTAVLFFGISVYGQMVLTGVLEEKASRVVEVLLARIPAHALLAGKIAGIGLLGLAQIGVTALAALVAAAAVRSVDVPAVQGSVLAWAIVWFVLGYALYATVYGALGSLGSRVEDAQSVAGPVMVVMVVAYFASFATIGQPNSVFARAISYFPLTAPMAMPDRIGMGAAAWWEPVVAAMLTLAAIAGLVQLAGRVYTRAILHSGPALSLRDIWRDKAASGPGTSGATTRAAAPPPQPAGVTAEGRTMMTGSELTRHRWLITILTGIGVVIGVAVAVFTADVIIGVAAGAGFIAIANQMVRLWTRHAGPPSPIAEIRHAGTGFQDAFASPRWTRIRISSVTGPRDSRLAAAVTGDDGPAGDPMVSHKTPKAQPPMTSVVQCTPGRPGRCRPALPASQRLPRPLPLQTMTGAGRRTDRPGCRLSGSRCRRWCSTRPLVAIPDVDTISDG